MSEKRPREEDDKQNERDVPFLLRDFSTWVVGKANLPRRDLIDCLNRSHKEFMDLAMAQYGEEFDAKKEEVRQSWEEITYQVREQPKSKYFYRRIQPEFTDHVQKHITPKTFQHIENEYAFKYYSE
eukprot:PhF_6_TR43864/c0_g1_i1/m.67183